MREVDGAVNRINDPRKIRSGVGLLDAFRIFLSDDGMGGEIESHNFLGFCLAFDIQLEFDVMFEALRYFSSPRLIPHGMVASRLRRRNGAHQKLARGRIGSW
jgi:hypothetical protein